PARPGRRRRGPAAAAPLPPPAREWAARARRWRPSCGSPAVRPALAGGVGAAAPWRPGARPVSRRAAQDPGWPATRSSFLPRPHPKSGHRRAVPVATGRPDLWCSSQPWLSGSVWGTLRVTAVTTAHARDSGACHGRCATPRLRADDPPAAPTTGLLAQTALYRRCWTVGARRFTVEGLLWRTTWK